MKKPVLKPWRSFVPDTLKILAMLIEQRIRAFLFYLSVLIFITGLPLILSSSFGYKFDRRNFKFARTGLIALKTQPPGANIYCDQKLLNDKTPATLNEFLPGRYIVRLELKDHYPWVADVQVEAGKVSRLEKIILFPLRSNVKKLNRERLSAFWVDQDREIIYYVNQEENSVYRSDLNGEHYEKLADITAIFPPPIKWVVSPDEKKLLYFNEHQIGLANIRPHKEQSLSPPSFILNYSPGKIAQIFWHSDSYHLVLISDQDIAVLEAKPDTLPTVLVTLSKKDNALFYDARRGALYFLDYQTAADGKMYNNLYKLELNAENYPLHEFIKLKSNEDHE